MSKMGWVGGALALGFMAIWASGGFQRVPEPGGCTGKREAVAAAEGFDRQMHPGDKRTSVLLNPTGRGTEVGLVFASGRAASYTIGPDCSLVGIN